MSAISTEELRDTLLEELHYTGSPDLKHSDVDLWPNGRPIPHIESAYFVQGVPVIYFSRLEDQDQDPDTIWKIYRSVWSQSKVPLLYVITPQEIRVYNGYEEPPEQPADIVRSDKEHSDRLLRHLQQLTDIETARQEINQQLQSYGYERIYVETGAFWQTEDGQKIKRKKRADQRLLRAMGHVRRLLLEHLPKDEHSEEIAYALLGRSIFIRYLEDRGVLSDRWVAEITHERAHDYLSALQDITITYDLFEYLNQRFNGDLFPVDEIERERVNQTHLNFLYQLLSGVDFETGQLPLFPYYDFEHIPIELISGIYDTFLSEKKREELGAYYTPLPLVDFIIEETLSRDKTQPDTTVLDPTCGSGVFLVRAYQRLIEAWQRRYGGFPSALQLRKLLQENIFGVDIQRNAVRIAIFSLYLAMLDYLSNDEIRLENFKFPPLKDSNLLHADLLSEKVEERFAGKKFDRVIGNLPWGKGTLKGEVLKRAKRRGYFTGGEQLVQPLLQHAPKFCADNGELALLASAKTTILVTSDRHEEFRDQFFQQYQVRAVVNFSALRQELFNDSVSPMVALFYQPHQPSSSRKIVYAVPKPSPLSQKLGAIVLDATEIKFLERDALLANPALWKIALWGNSRDAALITYLRSFPTLEQQAEKYGWTIEEKGEKKGIPQGFIRGGTESRRKEAPWLYGMPYVDTEKFKPYIAEIHGKVQETRFERSRVEEAYRCPITLIRRSRCEATFFAVEAVEGGKVAYKDKITGVPGKPEQENLLKWLAAYVNSSLVRYYHFMTSTSWAVERDTIIHEEYKRMPFLIPQKDDPRLEKILAHFDKIVTLRQQNDIPSEKEYRSLQREINQQIFELYDLTPIEIQVIEDTLSYVLPFFYWVERKQRRYEQDESEQTRWRHRREWYTEEEEEPEPFKRPTTSMLINYAEIFVEAATSLLRRRNQTLNATVYQDGAPLNVVEFELVSLHNAKDVQCIQGSNELRTLLYKLDRLLLVQQNSSYYRRRQVRIFEGPRFYLIHQSERHLWTSSQARADADGFVAELLIHAKNATTRVHH